MKLITTYHTHARKFYVIADLDRNGRKYYGTIEDRFVSKEGRLTKTLNGFEMCTADTLDEALKMRDEQIENEIETEGMDEERLEAWIEAKAAEIMARMKEAR